MYSGGAADCLTCPWALKVTAAPAMALASDASAGAGQEATQHGSASAAQCVATAAERPCRTWGKVMGGMALSCGAC